jgi:hypothetical protein
MRKLTQTSPPTRCLANLAFDSGRGRTVLFGGLGEGNCHDAGTELNDTWEYDGATWYRITTAVTPPGNVDPGFVYDSSRRTIVLAGGSNASGSAYYDTWEYEPGPGGGSGVQLEITNVSISPNPALQAEPVDIVLTIDNQGGQRLNNLFWDYSGSYSLSGDPIGAQPFTGGTARSYIKLADASQALAGHQQWILTIHGLLGEVTPSGQLQVNVQPDGGL